MIAVILGFLLIILLGAFLLMLPISNRNGEWLSPISALFTSTSATCVTGLTIGDPYTMFTFFGQLVILLLIQIGGLGFMSLAIILMMLMHKSISFSERFILSSSLGLSEAGGILPFVRMVVSGTFIIEAIGAALLSPYFISQNGFLSGLWKSIFLSISSFCNAGFDVLGNGDSLTALKNNGYVLSILMSLTIIGGLGFIVWQELLQKKSIKQLSAYTKMVLLMSGALLIGGAIFYLAAEWNNPQTLGNLQIGDKILNAMFSSVTMRTVGFSTFDMSMLTEPSKIISSLLMFIGGSSGSTAGGIKTVTAFILIITALQVASGRKNIQLWEKSIDRSDILRALSLVCIGGAIIFIGTFAGYYLITDRPILDVLFTTVSAFGTVGVAAYDLSVINTAAKIILIILMFMGRIGILSITLSIMIRLNRNKDKISYPKSNIMIG